MFFRLLAGCIAGLPLLACGGTEEPPRPNLVLIVIDSLRADEASMTSVAALAHDGVRFGDAFSHSPIALPAHAALLSSRRPLETRVTTDGSAVPEDVPLLSWWLHEAGYSTAAAVGPAALQPPTPGTGIDRGFDAFRSGELESELLDDLRGSAPFFLFVCIPRADANRAVGALAEMLRDRGLYEGTLVVLTAGRGEALGRQGSLEPVMDLRDELLRVPLVIKPPAGHPAADDLARAADKMARHVDVVPTVLDLLGLPELPGRKGTSLLEGTLRVLLAEAHTPQAPADLLCLRDDRYKLIYLANEDRFQMYDLVADPFETKDVLASAGGERAAWQGALRNAGKPFRDPTPARDD